MVWEAKYSSECQIRLPPVRTLQVPGLSVLQRGLLRNATLLLCPGQRSGTSLGSRLLAVHGISAAGSSQKAPAAFCSLEKCHSVFH